jgi:hypothetical protein
MEKLAYSILPQLPPDGWALWPRISSNEPQIQLNHDSRLFVCIRGQNSYQCLSAQICGDAFYPRFIRDNPR